MKDAKIPPTMPKRVPNVASTADAKGLAEKRNDKFTAIVFIHGIGRHARHENAGKLLEALELAEQRGNDLEISGELRSFRPRLEPASIAGNPDIEFMQFTHLTRRGEYQKQRPRRRFRLYEFNWSPLTKSALSPIPVLTWIIRKWPTWTNNWLTKPVMRLARLHKARKTSSRVTEYTWATLISRYRRFRGTAGRRFRTGQTTNGSKLADFIAFLKEGPLDSASIGRLSEGARVWDRSRLPCEGRLRVTGLLVFVSAVEVLAIACTAAIRAPGVVSLLRPSVHSQSYGATAAGYAGLAVIALLFAAIVYGIFKLLWFVGTIFSDVRYWASLDANDSHSEQRELILGKAADLLSHVAGKPECTRIVVIAHSLGTAIAFDALREIERRNKARQDPREVVPMLKLSHLFTLGSPIDKLTYIFESDSAGTYRAMTLRERLRGDLGNAPFWVEACQRTKWVNIWDRSDPVSDPLYTPLGAAVDGARILTAEIENIEVENTALFNPLLSHVTYLDNPVVVDRLYDGIFFNGIGRHPQHRPCTSRASRRKRLLSQGFIIAAAPAALILTLALAIG